MGIGNEALLRQGSGVVVCSHIKLYNGKQMPVRISRVLRYFEFLSFVLFVSIFVRKRLPICWMEKGRSLDFRSCWKEINMMVTMKVEIRTL